ncbi:MAG: YggS family pyridoxal phosphate-dependent enzyme [Deltaproteobacteria bacterium]|nr:YggS family pyridoxal phosphate-dependent enzyme [Deltaproteobacteria bacterium]
MPDRARQIAENIESVNNRIAGAARRSGRNPKDITLIAVSKTKPIQDIELAIKAGQVDFGENYVQELVAKSKALGVGPRLHMIGHLQRNKVKQVLGRAYSIHTLDSEKLARELDRRASWNGISVKVLIEVNIASEESKHGVDPGNVKKIVESVCSLRHLEPMGLMAVPPFLPDEQVRPYFRQLRSLLEEAKKIAGPQFKELSMGMSNDFEAAIEEGATMVRVGTAIFGARR